MTAIYKCDNCGEDLKRDFVRNRLGGTVKLHNTSVVLEVMCGNKEGINYGHLCGSCLHDAIHRAFHLSGLPAEGDWT